MRYDSPSESAVMPAITSVSRDTVPENKTLSGLLIGTAVGDALGLPFEGAPRRLTIGLSVRPLRHRFVFGRGMISDDTEHAAFTLRALAAAAGDPQVFRTQLVSELKAWIATVPPGVGLATLKACLKLCVGVPSYRPASPSAGNGAAMRAPVIGAAYPIDERLRHELVRVSTSITHSDTRAWTSARALADLVAYAVTHGSPPQASDLGGILTRADDGIGWRNVVDRMIASMSVGGSTLDYALAVGGPKGVTGFVEHSIPVAMHAYLEHGRDFQSMISSVLACGGDTDSVAALAGALYGATWGESAIPLDLVNGIADWPWQAKSLRHLARTCRDRFNGRSAAIPQRPLIPVVCVRNLGFLTVAILHVAGGLVRKTLRLSYV